MNAQCADCGLRGERGGNVVLYQVALAKSGVTKILLCHDCTDVRRDDGQVVDRLSDQSGTVMAGSIIDEV